MIDFEAVPALLASACITMNTTLTSSLRRSQCVAIDRVPHFAKTEISIICPPNKARDPPPNFISNFLEPEQLRILFRRAVAAFGQQVYRRERARRRERESKRRDVRQTRRVSNTEWDMRSMVQGGHVVAANTFALACGLCLLSLQFLVLGILGHLHVKY